MSERVAPARELVAAGHRPTVVARMLKICRQAIYRVRKPRRAPASRSRPPADEVEAAIVAVAMANPTDGYRLVTAWVRRRLGRPVNRKRVLRVMRERRLIQRRRRLDRRRRPGMQGNNAQLGVNERQVIVAAEITTESPDFGHLEPMIRATQRELAALGLGDPDVVLADAGYWHPPDAANRQ